VVAALPLLVGTLTGIYGAIAAMVVLPFTKGQMTLIAIFLLIAHNLARIFHELLSRDHEDGRAT
jgi:hypothetical protein